MEGRRGLPVQAPEEAHLPRVHEPRLEGIAVIVPHQVEAGVTAQEVQLFPERVAQPARLAVGRLHRDDGLAEHRRRPPRPRGGVGEGERQHVRGPRDPPVPRVQGADAAVIDQRQAHLVVGHPERPEGQPGGPTDPSDVDRNPLAVRDEDHPRSRASPRSWAHSS
jgi:hypothetical protein